MTFEIKNGLNIISIGLSEIGSYFRYKKPLAIVWFDCQGSVGKYLCQLPYDRDYRDAVRSKLHKSLNTDFTNNLEGLHTLLFPLYQLFPNGEYDLNFYHSINSSYFEYTSSRDSHSSIRKYDWFFKRTDPTDMATVDKHISEFRLQLMHKKAQGHAFSNILDSTTFNFYDGSDKSFISTQPKSEIDQERVKYFEDKISNGERPFIIIFKSEFRPARMISENYVLDGHHKLLAYQNLEITPSIAEITHFPKTGSEIEFDIESLMGNMYPWQIAHLLENCDEGEKYIANARKNLDGKIHNFIKYLK